MIKKLVHMLSQMCHKSSNSLETRLELKNKLDRFASENVTIVELLECLKVGQHRSIEFADGQIILSIQSSKTKYYWKRSDPRTAIACLAVMGEYETLETQVLKFFAKKATTIIDVGANIGYYVVELSQHLNPNGKIHAFEPVPDSFEQLTRNVELNNISTLINSNQVAVSNFEGSMRLYMPKTSGSSATSARNLHPNEKVEKFDVKTTTLDSYAQTHQLATLDLLKIDVEGAELMVIQGALNSIEQFKPVIFAELLRKWSAQFEYHPNVVLNTLLPLGYRCYAVSDHLPEVHEITNDTIETNFVFIPTNRTSDLDSLFAEVRALK